MHPLVLYYVRHRPQTASGVCAKRGADDRLELHGQDLLLAASVVDTEDLVEILLVPGHVDAHGPALPVDGQGISLVQTSDQTPGIIFLAVQLDEAGHALDRFSPQGFRVPIPLALSRFLRRSAELPCKNRSAAPASPPCFIHRMRSAQLPGGHDQGQGLFIKVSPNPLEFFKGGTNTADPMLPTALCFQLHAGQVGQLHTPAGVLVLAVGDFVVAVGGLVQFQTVPFYILPAQAPQLSRPQTGQNRESVGVDQLMAK